jgi:TRAP-type C4-dicarboxylate transport system permease small subunit
MKIAKIPWETLLLIQRAVMIVLAVFLSVMVCAEVAARYYVHEPILWVEEIIIFVVFWFYFTGSAYATYRRSHIVGGVLHVFIKNKPRVLGSFRLLAALISFGLCCLFIVMSYELFAYSLKVDPKTIHLMLHSSYARLSLLCTFPLMAFYFSVEIISAIRDLTRGVYVSSIPHGGTP